MDDTTMNFTKKEVGASTYKAKVVYFDVDGKEVGYVNYYADDATYYEDIASDLKENAAKITAGTNGVCTRNTDDDTWSVKYSSAIGEGNFSITVTRDYMLINGFGEVQPSTSLRRGQTLCQSSAVSVRKHIFGFISKESARRVLYWLFLTCLAVEERLLQMLLEE